MKERPFNIFLYANGTDRTIREIGGVTHEQERVPVPEFCFIVWSDGGRGWHPPVCRGGSARGPDTEDEHR